MADHLAQNAALIAFLGDIDARRVLTYEPTFAVHLELPGDEPADVTVLAGVAERAGLAIQPADGLLWQLTDRGREVLDRGAP
jgi:hypothetical protein